MQKYGGGGGHPPTNKGGVPLLGPAGARGRLHHSSESSCAHPGVGTGDREENTSVPISREEVTSRHHLSAMPDPLQPPLSLRMPCPEGIRQRRPRRERACDDLSTIWFRRSLSIYLLVTPRGFPGGHSHQACISQWADHKLHAPQARQP